MSWDQHAIDPWDYLKEGWGNEVGPGVGQWGRSRAFYISFSSPDTRRGYA